jgi:hypothetical protein
MYSFGATMPLGNFGVSALAHSGNLPPYFGERPSKGENPNLPKMVLGDTTLRFAGDSFTRSHSIAMGGMFAALLSLRLKTNPGAFRFYDRWILPRMSFETLMMFAVTHDIAKCFFPDLVKKPGKFSEEERKTMAFHTRLGAQLIPKMFKDALALCGRKLRFEIYIFYMKRITRHHHTSAEKLSTLPDCGELVRLAKVTDVLDALAQERAYRGKFTLDQIPERLLKDVHDGVLVGETTAFVLKNWDLVAEMLSIRRIVEDGSGMDAALEYMAQAKQITNKWLGRLLEQERGRA